MNISEIAKMAGVSSAAVSRYFNNGYISDEKKERIRKVVEETGYRPSVQAQTLRTKKTKMIGVILPKINSSSIGSVVAGIHTVLNESGYQLLLADTQNDPEKELEYFTVFNDKQVDGIIFIATVFSAKHKRILKELTVPVVIVGQRLSGYPCVYHDDYHSIYDITEMLIKNGCRNLGYVGVFHQDKAVGTERYEGFRKALLDHDLEFQEKNTIIADFTIQSGYVKTKELWEKYGPFDGLVCATDNLAVGALKYFREKKIDIPGQLKLTGHGDSSMSEVTIPALSSIHYSYDRSGEIAANILLATLAGQEISVREMKLGYQLVVRESTAAGLS